MGLSRRAYAEHRRSRGLVGGTLKAVQRALARGRIHLEADDSIDPERADREWAERTDYSEAPSSVIEATTGPDARRPGPPPAAPDFVVTDIIGPSPTQEPASAAPLTEVGNLQANNAAKAFWQAKRAELDYREAAGELVPAAEVAGKLEHVFRSCRTKLLGVPTRARQAMPDLTVEQVAQLEALVREALEDLAAGASPS